MKIKNLFKFSPLLLTPSLIITAISCGSTSQSTNLVLSNDSQTYLDKIYKESNSTSNITSDGNLSYKIILNTNILYNLNKFNNIKNIWDPISVDLFWKTLLSSTFSSNNSKLDLTSQIPIPNDIPLNPQWKEDEYYSINNIKIIHYDINGLEITNFANDYAKISYSNISFQIELKSRTSNPGTKDFKFRLELNSNSDYLDSVMNNYLKNSDISDKKHVVADNEFNTEMGRINSLLNTTGEGVSFRTSSFLSSIKSLDNKSISKKYTFADLDSNAILVKLAGDGKIIQTFYDNSWKEISKKENTMDSVTYELNEQRKYLGLKFTIMTLNDKYQNEFDNNVTDLNYFEGGSASTGVFQFKEIELFFEVQIEAITSKKLIDDLTKNTISGIGYESSKMDNFAIDYNSKLNKVELMALFMAPTPAVIFPSYYEFSTTLEKLNPLTGQFEVQSSNLLPVSGYVSGDTYRITNTLTAYLLPKEPLNPKILAKKSLPTIISVGDSPDKIAYDIYTLSFDDFKKQTIDNWDGFSYNNSFAMNYNDYSSLVNTYNSLPAGTTKSKNGDVKLNKNGISLKNNNDFLSKLTTTILPSGFRRWPAVAVPTLVNDYVTYDLSMVTNVTSYNSFQSTEMTIRFVYNDGNIVQEYIVRINYYVGDNTLISTNKHLFDGIIANKEYFLTTGSISRNLSPSQWSNLASKLNDLYYNPGGDIGYGVYSNAILSALNNTLNASNFQTVSDYGPNFRITRPSNAYTGNERGVVKVPIFATTNGGYVYLMKFIFTVN